MPVKPTCECGGCRKCKHRVYMRDYLRRHPEKTRVRKRQWYERNREHAKAESAKARRLVPIEMKRAQDAVAKAIKRGDLVRPDACERCGADGKPVAHHPDYAEPLRVEWLCRPCHGLEHSPHD